MSQQVQSQKKTEIKQTLKEGGDVRSNEPLKDTKDFSKTEEKFIEKGKFDDKKEFKSEEKTTVIESQPPEKAKAVAEVTIPISTEKESKFEMKKNEGMEKIDQHS
jgi:hypothetical protein